MTTLLFLLILGCLAGNFYAGMSLSKSISREFEETSKLLSREFEETSKLLSRAFEG
jgi:hypothetical protein